MGLTNSSVGKSLSSSADFLDFDCDKVVALAGNPNVGKSTVFNAITGLNQHTGNWTGKTVCVAYGECKTENFDCAFVDIPGTYSLNAMSPEEEIAGDFLRSGRPDAVVVVCDATCLERNLSLALQISEAVDNLIVCVNLMDEARRKGITVDIQKLSELLGVPVVAASAGTGKGMDTLLKAVDHTLLSGGKKPKKVAYPEQIEKAIASVCDTQKAQNLSRCMAIRILSGKEEPLAKTLCVDERLSDADLELVTNTVVLRAEQICSECVFHKPRRFDLDMTVDKIVTSKLFGYPLMLLLLAFIFWLTVTGANYPSQALATLAGAFENMLSKLLLLVSCPKVIHDVLVYGVVRVVGWVVSVMLPPMAIFFPLFTLLEDLGYLPRIAYNLDKPFRCCRSCGKQALTMCMGFGCNAAGVVGTRIIDSKRERLIAVITNSFVPCNGKFPTLVAIISMFFVAAGGALENLYASAILTALVVFSIAVTFAVSRLLSGTLLKGESSSFVLELPPYRRPQLAKVIVRSVLDRTLFVLGRAVAVAAPAGLVIWLLANVSIGDITLLSALCTALDPIGRVLGMDGVIIVAFILGFPANEIVVPVMLMAYLAEGTPVRMEDTFAIKQILVNNGWTLTTALCVTVFMLFHAPCSTTLMTVKKETGSIKWTLAAWLAPLLCGSLICFLISMFSKII